MSARALGLFEAIGIEIEYVIVLRGTLDVAPVSDAVLRDANGRVTTELERGALAWSNELPLHVIELKTNGPMPSLVGLAAHFQREIEHLDRTLEKLDARLMPTGMHPWMDPRLETRLWPHEYGRIYSAFDRIFDCDQNGWANLQATHINLPFADDAEFGRLHAAVRLLLPVLPALAASSPILGGRVTGVADNRLEVYRSNARHIPSVTGAVIPEPVFTRRDYEADVLSVMYEDTAPFDPHGVLRHEWLNARGAIPRFDRSTIEIRLLDVQECAAADLAVAEAVIRVLRSLVTERWSSGAQQRAWSVDDLSDLFIACVRSAEATPVTNAAYLAMFGYPRPTATARELWRHLLDSHFSRSDPADRQLLDCLEVIENRGSLASRIVAASGPAPDRRRLEQVYRALCDCLAAGEMFDGRV